MGSILSNGMGENPARARRGLEAAGAPSAVEIQAFNRSLADYRTGIGTDVDDATPMAQHPHTTEEWEQLHHSGQVTFENRQAAAEAVACVRVNSCTYD